MITDNDDDDDDDDDDKFFSLSIFSLSIIFYYCYDHSILYDY